MENELIYKISTVFEEEKKLLSEPEIVVLVCDRISDISGENYTTSQNSTLPPADKRFVKKNLHHQFFDPKILHTESA